MGIGDAMSCVHVTTNHSFLELVRMFCAEESSVIKPDCAVEEVGENVVLAFDRPDIVDARWSNHSLTVTVLV